METVSLKATKGVKSFSLPFLPPTIDLSREDIQTLLIDARTEIAELKGYSAAMPNPMLLLSPAILKESLASSEIENINTTLLNVLQGQLLPEIEQKKPDKEVLRYREAILLGHQHKLPISARLIKELQHTLLPMHPLGFRTDQNAIINDVTKKIIYVPPEAHKVNALITNWEKFVNNASKDRLFDPLINAIIAHYQFESIHPFNDGNGRTGRILMVLQLVQSNLLTLPILYISGYINLHRNKYYKLLNGVTNSNEWQSYIIFMLEGYKEQAKLTKLLLFKVMELLESYKISIKRDCPKVYNSDLVEALFSYPIISPVRLAKELGVHYITASKALKILETKGFLVSKHIGKYHLFANVKLMEILDGRVWD